MMGPELESLQTPISRSLDDRFCVDHLFLLVGKNPLPNYVAAELQLNPSGKLYLVHSETTRSAAERLRDVWTAEKLGQQPKMIPVPEADGDEIESRIKGELKHLTSARVGLNYTGGTKVMAVHAYQAMQAAMSGAPPLPVLSYLDARSNQLILDRPGQQTVSSGSLLYCLSPSLEQIVGLHAARLSTDIERTPKLADLASALAQVHRDPESANAWRIWCDDELRRKTRTRKSTEWDDEKLLARVVLQLPNEPALRPFVDVVREKLPMDSDRLPLADARGTAGMNKVKHLCEWLDGKWLEHHVLASLQSLRDQRPHCRLHDVGMGIRPVPEDERAEFDVDIGAMQGYQLYAISCTTDRDPGMCKLKLFEALVRARNMAGDEAYVGLVCYHERSSRLERDLSRSWDAKGQIRVFGRPEMADLTLHLVDWFESKGR